MIDASNQLIDLLKKFNKRRKELGITDEELESRLVLGPGWLNNIEKGKVSISLEMFFALLSTANIQLSSLIEGLTESNEQNIPRSIYALQDKNDLAVYFKYAKHDAKYMLPNAKDSQFESVIGVLRNNLAKLIDSSLDKNEVSAIKSEAVVLAFNKAVVIWPHANPSDIWWFIIHRAYLDPLNHPAKFSRLSFEQSWKRTGGWALEEIFVRHYAPALEKKGIKMFIAPNDEREMLLSQAVVDHRLEADKADIFLTGLIGEEEIFFGIVHVKASFAERRTDDVPMSKALVDAGYTSPLLTMDCKSSPGENPVNDGELGLTKKKNKKTVSAKRKDIEDDGYFSACFSYNKNTIPTADSKIAKAKIYNCDFNNPESDLFHNFICDNWVKFKQAKDL